MRNGQTTNGSTATRTVRKGEGRPTWELADLIRPLRESSRRTVRKPRMLPHYPAVIEYVYNSRLATAGQIRRRFLRQIRSDRTAQYQMARLVDLGLVATAPVRSTSIHFPHVYLATEKGIGLIRDTYAEHGVAWTASPGEERKSRGKAMMTVLHEILLTEFELCVWQSVESRGDLQLLDQERRYYRRERHLQFEHCGTTRRIEPDAGFLLSKEVDGGRMAMQYFVEMDMGTMSTARLRQKLRSYADWTRSTLGAAWLTSTYGRVDSEPPRNLYRLLFICHDKLRPDRDRLRAHELMALAAEMPRAVKNRIWVTSVADLPSPPDASAFLTMAVWERARNASEAADNCTNPQSLQRFSLVQGRNSLAGKSSGR